MCSLDAKLCKLCIQIYICLYWILCSSYLLYVSYFNSPSCSGVLHFTSKTKQNIVWGSVNPGVRVCACVYVVSSSCREMHTYCPFGSAQIIFYDLVNFVFKMLMSLTWQLNPHRGQWFAQRAFQGVSGPMLLRNLPMCLDFGLVLLVKNCACWSTMWSLPEEDMQT